MKSRVKFLTLGKSDLILHTVTTGRKLLTDICLSGLVRAFIESEKVAFPSNWSILGTRSSSKLSTGDDRSPLTSFPDNEN